MSDLKKCCLLVEATCREYIMLSQQYSFGGLLQASSKVVQIVDQPMRSEERGRIDESLR